MKTAAGPDDRAVSPQELPESLPMLPIPDVVVFPNVVVPVVVADGAFDELMERTFSERQLVVLAYPRNDCARSAKDSQRFLSTGTLGRILKMLRMQDSTVRLLIQGLERVRCRQVRPAGKLYLCKPEPVARRSPPEAQLATLKRSIMLIFREIIALNPNLTNDLREAAEKIESAGELADFVASNLELPLEEKKQIFTAVEDATRAKLVADLLMRERNLLELGKHIQSKVKTELDKDQREYYLREQLKVIRQELGEDDPQRAELETLERAVAQAEMSAEAREMAERELSRLRGMSPSASEYHVSRTYLDWLINLPWSNGCPDRLDIEQARRILDSDHFGLEEVKERIVEYLAVRQLKQDSKGPILCFVGPPGVGKTSLGKSIAHALGRKFCRMALGGIQDEAEIRGHRRTYIGSMPGRLIQQLRKVGTNNPVMMLDEVDKLGSNGRTDPSSALLEVLDPEQNAFFSDHYLEVTFDLSKVFFIATANLIHQVPPALRDRLETIEIAGYTSLDKLQIARRHILPRQLEECGLKSRQLRVSDPAISEIINYYTREAGVRALEREIASVARKTALRLLRNDPRPTVRPGDLADYLGPRKLMPETAGRRPEVGVATALAWTSFGGEILFVEALMMPGGKQLELTGQLGEVMKESALASHSFLRANSRRLGIDPELFANCDIHLHVPSGATPKDGPSAGVALVAAMASLFSSRPVRHEAAMTGEITLHGKVLPVGGIKEKILAAHRAGITQVILPVENKKDLYNLPEEVSGQLDFHFVKHIDEVLEAVLLSVRSAPGSSGDTLAAGPRKNLPGLPSFH
ncbi:MAG: endopeptidase La [Candidatus Glassbacteria bacterium]|nr:endopeptidase La [Candidatus Glassbacteria bacterium]